MRRGLSPIFASAEQVHAARLAIVPRLRKAKKFPRADGLLTDVPGQPLAIFTADCVPIFLSAEGGRVVGLLHAGWRGVYGGILANAIRRLRQKWRVPRSQVQAWAGPHIGPCCFEVKWDVAQHFPSTRLRKSYGGQARWTVDLAGELRGQAKRLGIRWAGKKHFGGCTMHGSRFYSYRRDKTDKRQVSVIVKKVS